MNVPALLSFQKTPMDMSILDKMYPRPRGPFLYGMGDVSCPDGSTPTGNAFMPCTPLGGNAAPVNLPTGNTAANVFPDSGGNPSSDCLQYADLAAVIGGFANCDTHDYACILCNNQKADALSNLVGGGCILPGTPISFQCQTSAADIQAFQNNAPVNVAPVVGGSPDTGFVVGTPLKTYTDSGPVTNPNFNPAPNKIVTTTPPSTPLTPMGSGIQSTGAAFSAGAPSGSAGGAQNNQSGGSSAPSSDNMLLYIGAGLAAVLLLTMRK